MRSTTCSEGFRVRRLWRRRASAAVLCSAPDRERHARSRRARRAVRAERRLASARALAAAHRPRVASDSPASRGARARSRARQRSTAELAQRYLDCFARKASLGSWRTRRARSRRGATIATRRSRSRSRRAEIAQSEHRFDDARADLKRVIERDTAQCLGEAHARVDRPRARGLRLEPRGECRAASSARGRGGRRERARAPCAR